MRCYGFQNEVKSYLNRLERENGFRISATSAKLLNDRVESLKKSRVWSQYSLGFNDTDGDSYLARAGVTDLIGRSEVLWFVRGMKALGLYSNMVAWPMRSYQNAGTGSTVFSLGGLGRFDGTMVNSPTWGNTGISTVSANTSYVSTLFPYTVFGSSSGITIGGCSLSYTGTNYSLSNAVTSGTELRLRSDQNLIHNSGVWTADTNLIFGSGGFVCFSLRSGLLSLGRNLTTYYGATTLLQTGSKRDSLKIGTVGNADTQFSTTTTSFAYGLFNFIESAKYLLYYNLYKQTLGSNLSLP